MLWKITWKNPLRHSSRLAYKHFFCLVFLFPVDEYIVSMEMKIRYAFIGSVMTWTVKGQLISILLIIRPYCLHWLFVLYWQWNFSFELQYLKIATYHLTFFMLIWSAWPIFIFICVTHSNTSTFKYKQK